MSTLWRIHACYMLDIETRDSLFNMQWFRNPWNMKLRIIRQNETREENIDVIETFNYLSV